MTDRQNPKPGGRDVSTDDGNRQTRRPLRLVIIEDNPLDAELLVLQLRRDGFSPSWTRVESESSFLEALEAPLDIILSDFNLPAFGPLRALDLLRERTLDVPLIVVSGSIGEEVAVEVLRHGAADYLLKDRLTRLGQAVQRTLDERRLQREKRRTEEEFRKTVERTDFALRAAGVGIWEADLTTGAAMWSPTMEQIHGVQPGTFAPSLDAFLERVLPEDRQQTASAIQMSIRTGTESNLLYRVRWPDGSLHWIQGIGRTFFEASGKPQRIGGIALDVTERRILEEEYRQSQKMEAIGQLAGGVAHDFNNLLTAILGNTELLYEQLHERPDSQATLDEIRHAAETAAGLTRQLLAFARRQFIEPRVLDPREVIDRLLPILRRTLGAHIEVRAETQKEVGCIRIDPVQMEQLILNLAINARDAMPKGGTLGIEVDDVVVDDATAQRHRIEKPGPHVRIVVSDTGTGMDEETQARVFEPFFTTKPKGRGTGLGLATVLGIVQQNGGAILLSSEPGRGSVFTVLLPKVADLPARRTADNSSPAVLRGSETILVVEDEKGVQTLMRRVLQECGYQVITAENPHEALALLQRPDVRVRLLLTDVVLPGMNGPELAAQVARFRSGIKVLYASGYTDREVVQGGLLSEGAPFIQKPFLPRDLARKIREVLDAD